MEYSLLKNEVSHIFGKQIQTTQDCKDLSDDVKLKTNQLISYNTLRRFFNVLKNDDTQLNTSTLNILCQYCGYRDFISFCQRKERIDVYVLDDYILEILSAAKDIEYEIVQSFCKEYYNCAELYSFLEKILLIARNTGQIRVFEWFYSLPEVFNYEFNKKATLQLASMFSICLKTLPEKEYNELLPHLAANTNSRKYFIEFYVDIDNLNNYYGQLLDSYFAESKLVSEFIFYHNLKILQAFVNSDKDLMLLHYNALMSIDFKKKDINPILQSRCYASVIYYSNLCGKGIDLKLKESLLKDLSYFIKKQKTLEVQLFVNFIFQALLLTGSDEFIDELFTKCASQIKIKADYWTDNLAHSFLIIQAQWLIWQKKAEQAIAIIEQINPSKFVRFEKNFQNTLYLLMLDRYQLLNSINTKTQVTHHG